jgi:hypothetical protein
LAGENPTGNKEVRQKKNNSKTGRLQEILKREEWGVVGSRKVESRKDGKGGEERTTGPAT